MIEGYVPGTFIHFIIFAFPLLKLQLRNHDFIRSGWLVFPVFNFLQNST